MRAERRFPPATGERRKAARPAEQAAGLLSSSAGGLLFSSADGMGKGKDYSAALQAQRTVIRFCIPVFYCCKWGLYGERSAVGAELSRRHAEMLRKKRIKIFQIIVSRVRRNFGDGVVGVLQ